MMNLATQLEELRQPFPECSTLVLADLAAGLVLGSNARNLLPREALNRLGAIAGLLLDDAPDARPGAAPPIHTAILIQGSTVQLFVRDPLAGDEAICCIGRPGLDTEGIAAEAGRFLAELSAGG
jgi:hypothetical protein